MKAGRINLLLVLMVMLSAAGFYFAFTKTELPECRAVVRISLHRDNGELERVMKLSMVPSGWRQVTLLINGSFIDEQGKYMINRAIVMSYRREGEHFNFLVKKNVKFPNDSVTRQDLDRQLPTERRQYHFLIEKMDERHFLFSSNHSPLFICTTSS